jgi:membrane-bound lytic murein transglycosylase B
MGEQRRTAVWMVALWAIFLWAGDDGSRAMAATKDHLFKGLQERLVSDGYDRNTIAAIYARPGVAFDVASVASFFVHRESKLNYGQFSETGSIKQARAYMTRHEAALNKAQAQYGVDKEVITAILLVETRLGRYTGRSVVINTLSTMAALTDPAIRDYLYKQIPKKKRLSPTKYNKKARIKSDWAYRELKALIEFTEDQKLDAVAIKGSYAGAMGLPQFMPSNAIKLGVDGSGDGKIDLFEDTDAIFSIAKYLKYHGWKAGISAEKAHRVIRRYNNSSYYADGVLSAADKLRN